MYNQLKSVSLFSGIGGLSFGKTQLYCEIDKQCRKVLLARMDDGSLDSAEIHSDILTLDSVPIGTELIYGGFPCVALSAAGKQAGIHGKETDMFFEMVRLIQQSKCSYCFFENVGNITRLTTSWHEVLQTMHEMGYDCQWACISAESVGAWQKRERWFMLCKRMRPPSKNTIALPDGTMYRNGGLENGHYFETNQIQGGFLTQPRITLLPLKHPEKPCKSTRLHLRPVSRKRWSTLRHKGGGYPANGLSARGASDIATQLRFEKSTPDELRWLPHLRPNPDWCDQFMGFPIGWSDYSKPLATTDHSFIEDTAIPRIIQGNIPASTRLKMLGNVCVPAQGKTAMEHLWNRLNCAELTPFLEALDVGNHPRKRKRA